MQMVLLTAIGVGGATLIGSIIGFCFQNISHRFSDMILSFAAGVMLCAAVLGLVVPSIEYGGDYAVWVTILGVLCGAIVLNILDKALPHLHRLSENELEKHPERNDRLSKVILFVLAIAIHNFPEGIAAGVGFGTENVSKAIAIAGGIALQNVPEGMVIIAPMLAVGISKRKTFLAALCTGLVEVFGTLFGYFAATLSTTILPFALAFAGGTMLYVISDEIIPETHHNGHRFVTYALLVGFAMMLVLDYYLG